MHLQKVLIGKFVLYCCRVGYFSLKCEKSPQMTEGDVFCELQDHKSKHLFIITMTCP